MQNSPVDTKNEKARNCLMDWLKGWAIIAVILDHMRIVPEPFVVWSVNIFVLVTAAAYSSPGYVFTGRKLALKILHLFYLVSFALLFFRTANAVFNIPPEERLLSIILNPYRFFVHNSYLGDIWYIALQLQFLFLLFFFLGSRVSLKPGRVFLAAAVLAPLSFFVTHFVIRRFHTILASSWLIFLAVGFYGLRPFLRKIETFPHNRLLGFASSLGLLVSLYGFYPLVPWAFTNENRSLFMTLPFYVVLVLCLAELFYVLAGSRAGKILIPSVALLGRYTLAIYLTHEPFARLWNLVFISPYVLAVLATGSGIVFGILTDRLFEPIRKFAQIIYEGCRPAEKTALPVTPA